MVICRECGNNNPNYHHIYNPYCEYCGSDLSKLPPASGCFIATATYGTPMAWEIEVLRNWRDYVLLKNKIGIFLVDVYYSISPPIAKSIEKSSIMRRFVKKLLTPLIHFFNNTFQL